MRLIFPHYDLEFTVPSAERLLNHRFLNVYLSTVSVNRVGRRFYPKTVQMCVNVRFWDVENSCQRKEINTSPRQLKWQYFHARSGLLILTWICFRRWQWVKINVSMIKSYHTSHLTASVAWIFFLMSLRVSSSHHSLFYRKSEPVQDGEASQKRLTL